VIAKVRLAAECDATFLVLVPPAVELPVPLIETDFERTLRAVDHRTQGVQQVGTVAGDNHETAFHSPPSVCCGKKTIAVFDKNYDTLRLLRGRGKHKNDPERPTGNVASPAREHGGPPVKSDGGVFARPCGARSEGGGASPVREPPIYKQHRIHTTRLPSGPWISLIVNLGRKTVPVKDALTSRVTRVPGEYALEDQAIQAARAYIDHEVHDLAE
jgi:hypothetical protein